MIEALYQSARSNQLSDVGVHFRSNLGSEVHTIDSQLRRDQMSYLRDQVQTLFNQEITIVDSVNVLSSNLDTALDALIVDTSDIEGTLDFANNVTDLVNSISNEVNLDTKLEKESDELELQYMLTSASAQTLSAAPGGAVVGGAIEAAAALTFKLAQDQQNAARHNTGRLNTATFANHAQRLRLENELRLLNAADVSELKLNDRMKSDSARIIADFAYTDKIIQLLNDDPNATLLLRPRMTSYFEKVKVDQFFENSPHSLRIPGDILMKFEWPLTLGNLVPSGNYSTHNFRKLSMYIVLAREDKGTELTTHARVCDVTYDGATGKLGYGLSSRERIAFPKGRSTLGQALSTNVTYPVVSSLVHCIRNLCYDKTPSEVYQFIISYACGDHPISPATYFSNWNTYCQRLLLMSYDATLEVDGEFIYGGHLLTETEVTNILSNLTSDGGSFNPNLLTKFQDYHDNKSKIASNYSRFDVVDIDYQPSATFVAHSTTSIAEG
jgi:hypothetical protein